LSTIAFQSFDFLEKEKKIRIKNDKLLAAALTAPQEGQTEIETYKGQGNLTLIGSVKVETYKGKLTLRMKEIDDECQIETYKGQVTFMIPDTQGLDLEAETGKRGKISSDFDIAQTEKTTAHMTGKINNGGPQLEIQTYKGDIRITSLTQ